MIHLFVPLAVAFVLSIVVVAGLVSPRAERLVTGLALSIFGRYVSRDSARRDAQVKRMRAALVGGTHRRYASRALFESSVFGFVGAICGLYLAGGLFAALDVGPAALRETLPTAFGFLAGVAQLSELSPLALFVVLLATSATGGVALAGVAYWSRWAYLDQLAHARASRIESTLPRTVAFIYALSRSGMPFPKVLDTLARNQDVYGEAAVELSVAVREMNAFGTDVLTTLQDTAARTPSEGLAEFSENLASVLGSGRSLSNFLREQYERYQDEAEAQQRQYLDLLSTLAEVYVTILVAGPLFFITVLVVVGLVISNTLPLIQVVTYLGIPLASAGFIIYIDSLTESLRSGGWQQLDDEDDEPPAIVTSAATDGGVAAADPNYRQLRDYDRLAPVRAWVDDPVGTLLEHPTAVLYPTVPVALVWLWLRVDFAALSTLAATAGTPSMETLRAYAVVGAVDRPLVEAAIVVVGLLSLVYEVRKRSYRRVERATPDFLDRMASVNEAGLTVVASIKRISQSDLGTLGEELKRAYRDIQWGRDATTALRRMANRTQAPMLARSMALITNAMRASGDISPVLRIAASETQDTRTLRRERRQEMLTYLVVIYISFFVFIGIIAALQVAFIPAIEDASSSAAFSGSDVPTGVFSGIQDVNTEAYTLIFFHVSVIQGVCSGLVAGQLGEGEVSDGLKHAVVLLLVAYVAFSII